jgi:hypothetical protein
VWGPAFKTPVPTTIKKRHMQLVYLLVKKKNKRKKNHFRGSGQIQGIRNVLDICHGPRRTWVSDGINSNANLHSSFLSILSPQKRVRSLLQVRGQADKKFNAIAKGTSRHCHSSSPCARGNLPSAILLAWRGERQIINIWALPCKSTRNYLWSSVQENLIKSQLWNLR